MPVLKRGNRTRQDRRWGDVTAVPSSRSLHTAAVILKIAGDSSSFTPLLSATLHILSCPKQSWRVIRMMAHLWLGCGLSFLLGWRRSVVVASDLLVLLLGLQKLRNLPAGEDKACSGVGRSNVRRRGRVLWQQQ